MSKCAKLQENTPWKSQTILHTTEKLGMLVYIARKCNGFALKIAGFLETAFLESMGMQVTGH